MSADFEKVLIKDPRLDVSDSIKYAVIKGGQNVTMAQYKAISQTDSQLVFNIQVPSEQTIIDRRVLLQTKLCLAVTSSATSCFYGIYSALASFPLHQLMTVLSVTINNNTVSLNVRDALPAIIRLLEEDCLVNYNSTTPTFQDTLASYSNSATVFGPNSSYWAVADPRNAHRGCFAPSAYTLAAGPPIVETFTWLLTEPLLISPFIFANLKSNSQGFYGIQNMNIVINIGNTARVFRGLSSAQYNGATATGANVLAPSFSSTTSISSVAGGYTTGSSTLFSDTQLLFNFLTPHPSDLMPARNIVPFYELPRYITSIGAADTTGCAVSNNFSYTPQKLSFVLNSLQLNQIPDKLIIYVRVASSYQWYGSPDVAFPITQVTVNFNNNSGILATATPVDLFQMSRKNGLNSVWNDWSGFAVNATSASYPPGNNQVGVVPTAGSYLVLEFGKDIQLTEDFYAAGSLGNFNLQVNMTVLNNNPWTIAANQLEAVLITMNSGVFVCERGTSSTYTGILTKQDVLEASQQEHYTHDDVARMVGGGFFGALKSAASNLVRQAAPALGNMARQGVASLANQGAQFVQGQVERHAPGLASHSQALLNRGVGAINSAADRGISRAQGEVMSRLPPASSRRPAPSSRRRGRGYVPEDLEGHY